MSTNLKVKWTSLTPRERDALVAERVMGLEVVRNPKGGWSIGPADCYDSAGEMILFNPLLAYSEDISATWQVVEKLVSDGWRVDTVSSEVGGTDVVLSCIPGARGHYCSDSLEGRVTTAPEAICLAALRAAGVDIE
jgi:hypothetical protein